MMNQQTGQAGGHKTTGLAAAGFGEGEVAAEGLKGLAGGRVAQIERKRVEAVVETLANLRGGGESVAEVAHDARNMVTALGLYCDLLEEPGVLTAPFLHYAHELRLVATASRRLVEKLLALDLRLGPTADRFSAALVAADPNAEVRSERARRWELMPAEPIDNLAREVLANRNLLAALAGPSIALTADVEGGALPVRLTGEDLSRILVNLVKNAAEAMPDGGRIQLGLHELPAEAGSATQTLSLTVDDNGPGIPRKALEKIFESGYTTRPSGAASRSGLPASHRGLGLAITRSIVEAAGGRIHAVNRAPAGTRFKIELPIRPR
jgi:signal transduction histidine kinase